MVLGYRFLRPFGSKRQSRAIDSFLYCKGTKKNNAKQEFGGFISDLFQMLKFSPLTIEHWPLTIKKRMVIEKRIWIIKTNFIHELFLILSLEKLRSIRIIRFYEQEKNEQE